MDQLLQGNFEDQDHGLVTCVNYFYRRLTSGVWVSDELLIDDLDCLPNNIILGLP